MMFLAGLAIFFAAHFFTAFARGTRAGLIDRVGGVGYRGLYSLVSLLGLALIVFGWLNASTHVLYTPPYWMRHIAYLLVLAGLIMVAAAYLPRGRIAARLKHPMLAGLKTWALAHLLVNGDVRSVLLFGAFLAYGVADRIALKRRGDMGAPAVSRFGDITAIAVGAAAWVAIYLFLHPIIAGVALR